ncbi:hypothetical protein GLOIN_2v1704982 [Rhizophagus irregularis DAOM 181602=DAOM 197198]|uniref:Uncharacterized protein n=1 Tax=Rhizophagus irregularis (strain DAOM 181602 / DAOM 197198 / MUCL 43194) TaxID=747089 RepID=A0A2P4P7C4_RHIID|nr:hypothetical protein GLOIN_2v1704982 [Rhizophagus irregularis DAOM 181602=DAOM 197198]POG61292.1 hypothetical protein GLOIN_2v1704982 [Rhizophagus irregularis DAOM 181602=DAOM 197198]|eukprot:XP_025168158.1 hypothetical protein GLOIN_2v1704982 [Rhizophagus irregularis DAOM 181602=DAOM 197198]
MYYLLGEHSSTGHVAAFSCSLLLHVAFVATLWALISKLFYLLEPILPFTRNSL